MRRIFLFAGILLSLPVLTQEAPPAIHWRLDWEAQTLELTIGLAPPAGRLTPDAPHRTLQDIQTLLPLSLRQTLSTLRISSRITGEDFFRSNPDRLLSLLALPETKRPDLITYSQDLSRITARYTFSVPREILPHLLLHHDPDPLPERIGWVPADTFSGLVIDAKGTFPVYGKQGETAALTPSLFPRLYSTTGELVLSERMIPPQVLTRWGAVAFTTSYREEPHLERIGAHPLRIRAEAVFGQGRTDLVIPEEAVRMLLAHPENQRILTEGRILVICENVVQEGP
ncbi:OmpA family protein [Spirochaeta thermophila DSM 6578]|uniref:OmpA family protein n=1 Tax=Winmispira thermophila (strain ATCC 700085 / DSM 6578 / Z-1203) TaxID=869211 RepID=G0GD72_WINT7|nr:hypothetical protein [Spirochaeta thermophila]AEJ62147.1 OmpA family protein [Spirochaeta thermophila DSM 6578]